jgi:hypothetical protein
MGVGCEHGFGATAGAVPAAAGFGAVAGAEPLASGRDVAAGLVQMLNRAAAARGCRHGRQPEEELGHWRRTVAANPSQCSTRAA